MRLLSLAAPPSSVGADPPRISLRTNRSASATPPQGGSVSCSFIDRVKPSFIGAFSTASPRSGLTLKGGANRADTLVPGQAPAPGRLRKTEAPIIRQTLPSRSVDFSHIGRNRHAFARSCVLPENRDCAIVRAARGGDFPAPHGVDINEARVLRGIEPRVQIEEGELFLPGRNRTAPREAPRPRKQGGRRK